MKPRRPRFIRVRGMKYRCTLRYAEDDRLSHLASFFYDEVLPVEKNIDQIISSFGLPPRVIEDVLVELIRKNYASLKLTKGQIEPAPTDLVKRKYVDVSKDQVIEVWQDESSGGLIPMDMLGTQYSIIPETELIFHLNRSADSDHRSFRQMEGARIKAGLRAADRNIIESPYDNMSLDSIVNKEKIAPHDIYVEIKQFSISEKGKSTKLEVIYAPSLPWWFAKAWTSIYRRQTGEETISDAQLMLTQAEGSQNNLQGSFRDSIAELKIMRWQTAWNKVISRNPPILDNREETIRSHLSARLNACNRSSVKFESAKGACHLVDLASTATHPLLLVGKLDLGSVKQIIQTLRMAKMEFPVLLIDQSVSQPSIAKLTKDEKALTIDYFGNIATELSSLPNGCFNGGQSVTFGSPETLLANQPLVKLRGTDIVEDLYQSTVDELSFNIPKFKLLLLEYSHHYKKTDTDSTSFVDAAAQNAIEQFFKIGLRMKEARSIYDKELYRAELRNVDSTDDVERAQETLSVQQIKNRSLLSIDKELKSLANEIRFQIVEKCLIVPYVEVHYGISSINWIADAIEHAKNPNSRTVLTFFTNGFPDLFNERSIITGLNQSMLTDTSVRFVTHESGEDATASSQHNEWTKLLNRLGGRDVEFLKSSRRLTEGVLLESEDSTVFVMVPIQMNNLPLFSMSIDSKEFGSSLLRSQC